MYKDRFGITDIANTKYDNLIISIDEIDEPVAMMLYTPNIDEEDHFHIAINKEQAVILRDWLSEFIKDDVLKRLENGGL